MADNKFVVIRCSGRAENCKAWATYWSILSEIYDDYQRSGGNWDHPNMLLLDGKVVIPSGLADKAWEYGRAKHERTSQMVSELQTELAPVFLKEPTP